MSDFIHYRQNRNSDYFGSVEVEVFTEQNLPCVLQIINVEYKENKTTIQNGKQVHSFMVNGKPKDRAILVYFANQKPWICNPTNCKILERVLGKKNAKEWIGETIELYVDYKVQFAKEVVSGVRVKAEKFVRKLPELKLDTPQFDACKKALKSGYTIEDFKQKYAINEEVENELKKEEVNEGV
jgi:hypothetical protein